jgi:hypothetical protein
MNAITQNNAALFQYSVYSQNYQSVSNSSEASGKGQTKSIASYQQEIVELRMEVLFNTTGEVGKQTAAASAINLADFANTPPEQHMSMIEALSPEQASELISEDGYYGIAQTAQRLSEFVLMGAGDDLDKLRAGREGIMRGFKEAEEMWGGKLPELSYKTIDSAMEQIDGRIRELGGSVLDLAA